MFGLRILVSLALCCVVMGLVQGCGQRALCDGEVANARINPRGSMCVRDCECNNLHYTGRCLDGVCQSDPRVPCEEQGAQRTCALPLYALVKGCTEGIQVCQPPELKDVRRWGDCKLTVQPSESGSFLCTDGKDNDCDGKVDLADEDCLEGCIPGEQEVCYQGKLEFLNKGICRVGIRTCTRKGLWGPCDGDIKPEKEICDGLDNNCDGQIDEGFDEDGDGFTRCGRGKKELVDCDDTDKAVYPSAPEICDGKDNNCDGRVDEDFDRDRDGFIDCKGGRPGVKDDCDDADKSVYPGAPEVCDGKDNDCDGAIDEELDVDEDGDGYSRCPAGGKGKPDCNDLSKAAHPGGQEVCDGVDNDCDGVVDEGARGCVTTLAGAAGVGFADGPMADARFREPGGLVFDPLGNLYVADSGNHRIRKLAKVEKGVCGTKQDYTGWCVTTLAGLGVAGFADGPALEARFNGLRGLAFDASGNLIVADTENHRIRMVAKVEKGVCGTKQDYTGWCVTTLAGSGVAGFADGPGPEASFRRPTRVTGELSDSGVFVADTDNHAIRYIKHLATTGYMCGKARDYVGVCVFKTIGSGTQGFLDGSDKETRFAKPMGLLPTILGLYVVDSLNHRIRRRFYSLDNPCKSLDNTCVVNHLGDGVAGLVDGVPSQARFNGPRDMAFDSRSNIYIADTNNHSIRLYGLSGQISTIAGSGKRGMQDGYSDRSAFDHPVAVAVDTEDVVYISDRDNHRIRRLIVYR